MPSKAENQTAKRVPEFCRPSARSKIHASSEMAIPSRVQFRIRSEPSPAKDCRLKDWKSKSGLSPVAIISFVLLFLQWFAGVGAAASIHWLRCPGPQEYSGPAIRKNP